MDEQDDIFDTCDHCGKPIFYGNACVTITRSIEQVDRTPEYPEGVVNVIDSVCCTPSAPSAAIRS